MISKKKGFTLVELMAVMSISLIAITLIYLVLNQGSRILNRTNNFSKIGDSFRNTIVDIQNELDENDLKNMYFNSITSYLIDGFEVVEPIILIDNDVDDVLYFKGKKNGIDKFIIAKVYFDKDDILDNKIRVKNLEVLINEIKGNLVVSVNKDNIIEVVINEIGSDKENRSYSSLISLNKNNELTIDFNEKVIEPEIPSLPTPPAEIPTLANLFAKYTFIVLDINGFNKRENLINIQPMFENENKNIDISNASYYIQAISTEVMKKYISSNTTINNNTFIENDKIMKAPAMKSEYSANGLTINGYEEFKKITQIDNGKGAIIKNGESSVGYLYRDSNQAILLLNGDLNINSNDKYFYLAIAENGAGHKLTIYCTGKINVNMNNKNGVLYLNNCSLISANQININSNYIEMKRSQAGDIGKLQQVLNDNLKLQ